MNSISKLLILVIGTIFLLLYCDDRHYLGHAGNLGGQISSGPVIPPNTPGIKQVKATAVYYEPTIKNIISTDCARCHSGANRNLMDYDSLKIYADSGLLATMVQGPMRRFAGNDGQTIVTWAQNGAPEKPTSLQAAALKNQNMIPAGAKAIYYEPTIKNIINNDCSQCHSGPSRNLMDYGSLKMYADTGLLATMVQGPMSQFAGNDAQTIITWAQNGAPEKSASVQAAATKIQNNVVPAAAQKKIYYEPTIKNIISNDCAQCHSGPSRNLMDYDSLKMYADTGLLATMVQGPMSQFAGNDAQTIITWAQSGAPEKSPTIRVFFRSGGGGGGGGNCPQGAMGMGMQGQGQQGPITYNNGIRQVLAKDCLRCHSGPFRNLTTYDNVKIYVDNGLLKSLVSVGGPMHRFAGPDSHVIIAWIDNGAPQ
jgi:hypothetical protein